MSTIFESNYIANKNRIKLFSEKKNVYICKNKKE